MKRAAIGVRMHSGWGVLVAVSTDVGAIEVIDRRRVVVIDPGMAGASRPYHFAEKLELSEAEKYLANHGAASERLSIAAVRDVVEELQRRECRVAGSGILLASGRPLPPLSQIFASHALIHTAEGELFRNIFRRACERLEFVLPGFESAISMSMPMRRSAARRHGCNEG